MSNEDPPPRRRMVKPPSGGLEQGRHKPARLKTAYKRTPSQQAWLERQINDPFAAEARAKGCPEEARRISRSWLRLLLPYVAPKFEMTEEKANRLFERRERERNRNTGVQYVR